MANKGKPSGNTRSEGTGTPSQVKPAKLRQDNKFTQEYTDDDKKLADHVKSTHPNRNVNKQKPTNIHGYRG